MDLEAYPDTTLLEIDLRFRAKELERYAHARTLIELQLAEMSAMQLGKDEEERAKDESTSESDRDAWEARGEEIKASIRKGLYYSFAPEHVRAMLDAGQSKPVLPLLGISPSVARTILGQLEQNVFTEGPWRDSVFRKQLSEGDTRARLEAAAKRGRPNKP